MKVKQNIMLIAILFTAIFLFWKIPLKVSAAEATITFGSNWYNKTSKDTFPVGVYLNAGAAIGDYHIEIKYDSLRLQYVDGATGVDEENGILILEGNQNGRRIKFWLRFKAISGGEAFIEVSSAEVWQRNSADGELFLIEEYDNAPVHIKGEDTAAVIEARLEAAQEREETGEGNAGSEEVGAGTGNAESEEADAGPGNGGPEEAGAGSGNAGPADGAGTGNGGPEEAGAGVGNGGTEEAGAGSGNAGSADGAGTGNGGPGESGTGSGNAGSAGGAGSGNVGYGNGAAAGSENEGENESPEGVGQGENGAEGTGRDEDGNHGESGGENSQSSNKKTEDTFNKIKKEKRNYIFFNVYFVFTGIVVLLVVIIDIAAWNILKRVQGQKDDGKEDELSEPEDDGFESEFEFIDLDSPKERVKSAVPIMLCDDELEWRLGRPVIKVCDVTMEFKLSSINPSGLKEYLVQLLKREVSYRKLYALYHVSFNVYKGEVIGIIGTNGSGKSTLLKIVSGALKPTSGYVDTGRRKIQLLTLGTGFDMELTARENVFLNGAIIGYRKEFLETHYDEIVEFAELQDFMEEKVKNFSSGMVSRLGFAIATAGDAAEILILDEILSVGDEFFRQKSLKRIKEMIHGGSTVLLVSHSMGTILEHCTRCVWIEKGELQMVGEPKTVCGEYRRMNEKG